MGKGGAGVLAELRRKRRVWEANKAPDPKEI